MKETTTIRIDMTLRQRAKALNINLSQTMDNVLRGMIASKEENGLDILEIRKEIDKIEEDIIKLRTRETELLGMLSLKEQEIDKAKKQRAMELERLANSLKASGFLRNQGEQGE